MIIYWLRRRKVKYLGTLKNTLFLETGFLIELNGFLSHVQHILGHTMTFPVLLVEEDLIITQTK